MLGQDHYIYRLRAACVRQPHWNRHQLAALDHELSLSLAAPSLEAYLEASGDLIGLARATALDRAANAYVIALRADDPWSAAAAAVEYEHAQQGASHAELYVNIASGHEAAADLRAVSLEITTTFARLFRDLICLHTSNYEIEFLPHLIQQAVQTLRRLDPVFIPQSWIDQPRYRRRLPWHTDLLHAWLAPYWGGEVEPPAYPVNQGMTPAAVRWGAVEWPDVEPLEAPPAASLAEAYRERQAVWPDPFLAAHWQTTHELLTAAVSPIARYAVAGEREAAWSVDSTRHALEWEALLAPLTAIATHGWQPDAASEAAIGKAVDTLHSLTGLRLADLLQSEAMQSFLIRNLAPQLAAPTEMRAMDGEAGFDLLRHARLWQATGAVVEFNP